jgi:predicted phage terminase large subunit-like protein
MDADFGSFLDVVPPEVLEEMLANAPKEEQKRLLDMLDELNTRRDRVKAKTDFIHFVQQVWPDFISGAHHRRIAKLFEAVARGEKKRVIINLGPRHTKSEFASYLLPAWFLGQYPKKKIMQISNTAELAEGFGRKVRNLVDSADYKRIFPELELRTDSKAAGRWNTNHNGEYFASGVGGTVTGRGADLLIIDDPHSEGEAVLAQFNPDIYDKVFSWYTSGPRQRLQPGGAIIIVMTRWSLRDLTGQILEHSAKIGGDKWEVIEFPAILPSGKPLWPEFWALPELEAVKNEIGPQKWQAQYQQQPTSEANAIVKREWWQEWKHKNPPDPDFIIMALDTAFEAKTSADYSAFVVFGVWENPEDGDQPNLMLLEAYRARLEFPDLKARLRDMYAEWEPDSVIIEKKASGAPLIYEMRRMGIPVQEYTPSRGNDKITRLNAVADIFASGKVWAPKTRWAEELIDEMASFPAGKHDDFVDATTLALQRFRSGGFIGTASDKLEEDYGLYRSRKASYY